MKKIIHMEKKAQAHHFFESFEIEKRDNFAYKMNENNPFAKDTTIVWFPIFYLLGVLIELHSLKRKKYKDVDRIIKIYESTPLPQMLLGEKELGVEELEEAFGSYLDESLKDEFRKVIEEFKNSDEIIFYGDGDGARINFELLYKLSKTNAKCFMFKTKENLEKMEFEGPVNFESEENPTEYDKKLFENALLFLEKNIKK